MKFKLNRKKTGLYLEAVTTYDEMLLVNILRVLVSCGRIEVYPEGYDPFDVSFYDTLGSQDLPQFTSEKERKEIEDFIS